MADRDDDLTAVLIRQACPTCGVRAWQKPVLQMGRRMWCRACGAEYWDVTPDGDEATDGRP